jgi:nitroreductase
MQFSELVRARYSVRSYSGRPVEDEKLRAVLEAGRVAPTAKNIQPACVYAVRSADSISRLRAVCNMAFDAPVVLIVCADLSESFVSPFTDRNFGDTDAAIVTDHMMMQATELGLGTCWVGWFDPAPIKEALGIPEGLTIMDILPMGYPSDSATPSPRHSERKPMDAFAKEI